MNFRQLFVVVLFSFSNVALAQAIEENPPAVEVNFDGWKDFADNISKCTSSTFVLPDPVMIKMMLMTPYANFAPQATITYKIIGMKENMCEVEVITNTISGVVNNVPTFSPTVSYCLIPSNSLIQLYNRARDFANNKELTIAPDDPVTKLMNESCKITPQNLPAGAI